MKNVLIISDYAAQYGGNFIPSFEDISHNYKYGNVIYAFPETVVGISWAQQFCNRQKTYFLPRTFFSKHITVANILALREICQEENITIIHTNFIFYNYTLCLAKYTFARHIKFIGHFHNQFSIPDTIYAPIKKWIVEHTFDLIIGVSQSVADGVKRQTNCKNVIAIDNAIYFPRLDTYENIELRDDPNQIVILMAGWPAYVKGVDIAAKAIKSLREEGNNIKLCIMQSGGIDGTIKCIKETIGYTPDWVHILPPRDDIATYYHAADIFLSTSRSEGFSYCLIEAVYCEAIVISSDIPGPRDLKTNSIIFAGNTDISIRRTLKKGIEQKKSAKTKDNFASEESLSIYDYHKWTQNIINIAYQSRSHEKKD